MPPVLDAGSWAQARGRDLSGGTSLCGCDGVPREPGPRGRPGSKWLTRCCPRMGLAQTSARGLPVARGHVVLVWGPKFAGGPGSHLHLDLLPPQLCFRLRDRPG